MTSALPKFPRPIEGDCAKYYFRYTDKVPDVDIIAYLTAQQNSFSAFISGLAADQLSYRYEANKWSLAEMIGHVLDAERVFSYRMMCISRGETKSLPGFEQDEYVRDGNYNDLSAAQLAAEWQAVRSSTILMCNHMSPAMAARKGVASDFPVSVSAFPWIMAGHVNHHLEVAHERYGLASGLIR